MKKSISILVAVAILGGCSARGTINPRWRYQDEPASPASLERRPLREHQVDLKSLLESELTQRGYRIEIASAGTLTPTPSNTIRVSGAPQSAIDQLIAAVDVVERPEDLRNDVIGAWLTASTANCSVYLQSMRSGQVNARLATDFFAGAFATAASLATPPASADILAGLSALSTAQGSSIDRNIFAQQGAELVAEAILQLRAERRAAIESRLSQSYTTYPLGLALADLYGFHNDCSMLRGFSRMREAVVAREQTIQAIRKAAAAVQEQGGSSQEVVAVLSGLDRSSPLEPGGRAGASDLDIALIRKTARDCLQAAAELTTSADADVEAAFKTIRAGACAPVQGWQGYYLVDAQAVLTNNRSALAVAQTAAAPDSADTVGGAGGVASTEAVTPLASAVTKALAEFDTRAQARTTANLAARQMLVDLLAQWDRRRPADLLPPMIRALAGEQLLSSTGGQSDPVFALALAAAENSIAQAPGLSSDLVARQARMAAVAFMAPAEARAL